MGFVERASALFPDVEWHGKSDIHVSVCGTLAFIPGNYTVPMAMSGLAKKGIGIELYHFLRTKFPSLKFVIGTGEFNSLFLSECYKKLIGGKSAFSKNKIVNPITQSEFHFVAVRGDIVAGFRVWVENGVEFKGAGKGAILCFRFRVTSTPDIEEKTTERVRVACEEAKTELELAGIDIEIAEPPKTSVKGQTALTQLYEEGESL